MLRSVFTKALWDSRRALLGWAAAAAAVTAMYASFYQSMRTPEMARSMEAFSPKVLEAMGMTDMTSAVGYLESSVFALVVPILALVFAAALAARTIAADEESGTLDLVLSHPVGRVKLALERFTAAAIGMVVFGLGVWLAVLGANRPAELDLGLDQISRVVVHLVLLGWAFTALGFAVGAISGRRAHTVTAVALVGVVSYACNTVVTMIDGLDGAEKASAFYYYEASSPLRDGVDLGEAAVLLAAAVVLVAIGTVAFSHRDVAT